MGSIIAAAIHSFVGSFFLYFVIIPVSIIFLGYLVYIVVELIKEIKKNRKRFRINNIRLVSGITVNIEIEYAAAELLTPLPYFFAASIRNLK